MNLTEYAEKYFEGDQDAAIFHLIDLGSDIQDEEALDVVRNFTKEESENYVAYAMVRMHERDPKGFKKMINQGFKLGQLNMSEDEILAAEVNPFKAKFLKPVILFAVGSFLLVATALITKVMEWDGETYLGYAAKAYSVLTTYCGMTAAPNLINFFRFRKIKKELENE